VGFITGKEYLAQSPFYKFQDEARNPFIANGWDEYSIPDPNQ
jgi:hypothetical protein